MKCSRQVIVATCLLLLVTGCGPKTRWDHTPRQQHIVRSGETVFAIAWRYGLNPNALARWNRLGNGSLIHPGQVLRLTAPANMQRTAERNSSAAKQVRPPAKSLPPIPTQPSPKWRWPSAGKVAVSFGKRPGPGTGILLAGRVGQPVIAAAAGRVVYSGGGLIGYGQLIIIKHNETYLSAYGHNSKLLVKEGASVRQGQRIATMGEGPGRKPRLHFEIRKNGEPVNPLQFLPRK